VQVRQGVLIGRSGMTEWVGGRWLITLSDSEPLARRRFTLAHEFAHVVNHAVEDVCFPAYGDLTAKERVERTCDYFAACLLMPRPWVKRLWGEGLREVRVLARRFAVSEEAMRHRLRWLGLTEPVARRCAGLEAPPYAERTVA
jgi:Zn-dependent peptidase ImmA (M78 family)